MMYLNLNISTFSSPEYIGAEPVQRATWLALLAWSCEQENGGRIQGCKTWGDRRWMQTCGVTAVEAAQECDLYAFDGDDIIILFYPKKTEEIIEKKRDTARENGRLGGRPKKQVKTDEKPTSVFAENPTETQGEKIGTYGESVKYSKVKYSKVDESKSIEQIPSTSAEDQEKAETNSRSLSCEVKSMPKDVDDVYQFFGSLAERPMTPSGLRASADSYYDWLINQGNWSKLKDWRSRGRIWAKQDGIRQAQFDITRKKTQRGNTSNTMNNPDDYDI